MAYCLNVWDCDAMDKFNDEDYSECIECPECPVFISDEAETESVPTIIEAEDE